MQQPAQPPAQPPTCHGVRVDAGAPRKRAASSVAERGAVRAIVPEPVALDAAQPAVEPAVASSDRRLLDCSAGGPPRPSIQLRLLWRHGTASASGRRRRSFAESPSPEVVYPHDTYGPLPRVHHTNIAARRGAPSDDAAASAARVVVEKSVAVLEVVFEVVGVGVAGLLVRGAGAGAAVRAAHLLSR